jgi:hypothetical protein
MEITNYTERPHCVPVLKKTAAVSTTDLLHGNQNVTYRPQVLLHISHYFT